MNKFSLNCLIEMGTTKNSGSKKADGNISSHLNKSSGKASLNQSSTIDPKKKNRRKHKKSRPNGISRREKIRKKTDNNLRTKPNCDSQLSDEKEPPLKKRKIDTGHLPPKKKTVACILKKSRI